MASTGTTAARGWTAAAIVVCAIAAAYALAALVPGADALALRETFAEWAMAPLAAITAAGSLGLAWRLRGRPGARSWALLGAAYALSTVGEAIWYASGRPDVSLADAFYLTYFPLLFAALVLYPAARRGSRAAFALDALIAATGGAVVFWYFVIAPTAAAGLLDPTMTGTALLVNVAYPLGDLLLVVGLATVLMRAPGPLDRSALVAIVASVSLTFAADTHYFYASLTASYTGGGLSDVAFVASYAAGLVAIAARHRTEAHARAGAESTLEAAAAARHAADGRGISLVPYVAVAGAYAVLVLATRPLWSGTPGEIVFGAGAVVFGTLLVTVAVVARQIVAMREHVATQRTLAREQAAREGEARFRALVNRSSDVLFILDAEGRIRYASPALAREFGLAPEAVAGTPFVARVHPDDVRVVLDELAASHADPSAGGTVRHRVAHADGTWRHVESVTSNLLDDPAVAGIVLNVRDVTERHGLEAQLAHQAFHDALTGLPNRALFRDRVAHAIERSARAGAAHVAVLFLDLDDFKTVNDSHGHQAGDELLVQVARRLLSATRGSDTVARLGGDEFAILLEEADSDEKATLVADRVAGALAAPFVVADRPARVGVSVGIARPGPLDGEPELLRNADVAMYHAKRRGKGGHVMFEAAMHAEVVERVEMERSLRDALAEGRDPADAGLWIAYQPIVSVAGGAPAGAEALVRWRHPARGPMSPADFIPMAEATGLIMPLGRWVLAAACREACTWPEAMRVSVNLSGRQLEDPGLVADVRAALRESGLEPARLTLEVTESVLMEDTERVAAVLASLRELGIRVALDDFGTGYSSLSYLHRIPVDVLKIDKSFVDRIDLGGQEAALTRSILMLGDSLGLQAVAEGVETDAQRQALADFGCPLAQGYLFARPLEASALRALLDERTDAAAHAG